MPEGPGDPLDRDDEEQYVRFDTFGPFSGPTDWHVNKTVGIGDPTGVTHVGLVFQRADARPQWLTIAYEEGADGWEPFRAAVMGAAGKTTPVTEMPDVVTLATDEEGLDGE